MNRVAAIAVLLACAVTIAFVRPVLFERAAVVKAKSGVYTLPPPRILEIATLGYRAAVADYLWAHVLVTQGLRMNERRPFPELDKYLDAINHLDPQFREPYRLTDSLMSFQIGDRDRKASVLRAKEIMERGLRNRPHDAELWLNYGQFVAYIAPGLLDADDPLRDVFRAEGARALMRAGEMGGFDESIMYRSMSAAAILSRSGERDAAIRFLERLHAMTEDEQVQQEILGKLNGLRKSRRASRDFELASAFDELWRTDLPFAPRTRLSVLGPPIDAWRCAGPTSSRASDAVCHGWRDWSEHVARGTEGTP